MVSVNSKKKILNLKVFLLLSEDETFLFAVISRQRIVHFFQQLESIY